MKQNIDNKNKDILTELDVTKKDIDKIATTLIASKNVVIAGHVQPDGDAIGSSFALALALKKIGKHPVVLMEAWSDKYDFIEGKEFIYQGSLEDLEVDVFVSLDTATSERLGKAEEVWKRASISICIDHHVGSDVFCDLNYVNPNASSTSELLFDVFKNLVLLDTKIATALYAGMVYDTGGFCHNSTTTETLQKASILLGFGINFNEIYKEFFYLHSYEEAKIFGIALSKLEVLKDSPIAFTFITDDEMKYINAKSQDTDGIVSYLVNTRGVEVGIFAYPRLGKDTKISLRSKNINIGEIATAFGGGGHKLAAGYSTNKDIDSALSEIIERIKLELKDYE